MIYDNFMKIREAQTFSDAVVDQIKAEQLKQGLSNYALAKKTGITEASISYIFRHQRRPTLYTLKMITTALEISLAEVIQQIENK